MECYEFKHLKVYSLIILIYVLIANEMQMNEYVITMISVDNMILIIAYSKSDWVERFL